MATYSVFLPGEPHEQYEKQKTKMTPEDEPLPDQKVSNVLPGKNGGQLLIAPERMK